MENQQNKKTIPLDYIRGLVVAQGGRCAITGMPLDPQEVNADHILPLSRVELSPKETEVNIWLVHKKVNAMKGTMTYEELVKACQIVLDHRAETEKLLNQITTRQIQPVQKSEFDKWVSAMCDETGRIKDNRNEP
ncbi:MAG TPA: hypothetical protein PLV42_00285 [bacterium]|nr:hypothetical protein [bacterium]